MVKFSFNSLKEHLKLLKITPSLEGLINKLDNLGVEVESHFNPAEKLKDFVIAQIVSLKKHPNADRLTLCDVSTSKDGRDSFQVVCGAQNLFPKMIVVLAKPETVIPSNGMIIKKSKIRGEESNGMLCSAEEIGLVGLFNSDGIISLPDNLNIGERLIDEIGLEDTILDVTITPNRGDCTSIFGIARDLVASYNNESFDYPIFDPIENNNKINFKKNEQIRVDKNTQLLSFALIENIDIQKETPIHIKIELWKSGFKLISAPVDIANYMMLHYGQPLHVYDADKITNHLIHSKILTNEEQFIDLNKEKHTLPQNTIVIQDDAMKTVSLGGIIGSLESCCTKETKNILIEAAYFCPKALSISSSKINIQTDARYNFERGVDIESTKNILYETTRRISKTCGGQIKKIEFNQIENKDKLEILYPNVTKFIGQGIDNNIFLEISTKLGFKNIKKENGDIFFIPPSWRHDITSSNALCGEVLRIYGYDKISSIHNAQLDFIKENNDSVKFKLSNTIRKILAFRKMHEAITWSFSTKNKHKNFINKYNVVTIKNPINQEMSIMRPDIMPNLLQAAKYNQNYGIIDISLFELGSVYSYNNNIFSDLKESKEELTGSSPVEIKVVTGIRVGTAIEQNIHSTEREYDVFDIKADVLAVLEAIGIKETNVYIDNNILGFCSAAIVTAKNNNYDKFEKIAVFGEIDKKTLSEHKIKGRVYGFYLNIDTIIKCVKNIDKKINIPNFQHSIRDFNFIFNIQHNDMWPNIYDIEKTIQNTSESFIKKVKLIDSCQKSNDTECNKIALCFRVTLQSYNKTLTSLEINEISDGIIKIVQEKHDGYIEMGKE